ncbi:MAG: CCA tRNA nucleotidyltransferase [Nitrosomonadaceae bacterium]|nr:CCA tRNA nucleotidyltransferase [Nitrosomonadaceae bacterium]
MKHLVVTPALFGLTELPTDYVNAQHIIAIIRDNHPAVDALLVGGCVRDLVWAKLTQQPAIPKDFDIEVYGLNIEAIATTLMAANIEVDLVGKCFGVLKVKGSNIDISVPRREVKVGDGHTDFIMDLDPKMSISEAAERRDFTINTLSFNPMTGDLYDLWQGVDALRNGWLTPVSRRFSEDPLRVLRGMQFIARFGFNPTPSLIDVCIELQAQFKTLAKERVFEEFNKMLLKGKYIGKALHFLKDTGWLKHFPELLDLVGVEQDPIFHPEGDAFIHTCHCLDAFAQQRTGNDEEDLIVGYAVLGHDFGKASTTAKGADGRWHAYGHEEASGPLLELFMRGLTNQEALIQQSVLLAKAHMRPINLFNDRASMGAIRRLALAVSRLDLLMRVVAADQSGRPPLTPKHHECHQWLMTLAAQLHVERDKPKPLVMGRHLIEEFQLKPGPVFSTILGVAFEAQLDGQFATAEDGVAFIRAQLPQLMGQ